MLDRCYHPLRRHADAARRPRIRTDCANPTGMNDRIEDDITNERDDQAEYRRIGDAEKGSASV